ncbi:hypothetical protein ACHHRT_10990 [Desulfurivibrio sp. D14AmB]|uniref:hypothetical protein n=1 Tax=Desulfurivibrio sp. D14AmB TaxID=3374370 RepID=UPI00376F1F7A
MDNLPPPIPAEAICFGLDRATDERSLIELLRRFARPQLLATLAPRLTSRELEELVDLTGRLMRQHLNHREYHKLFLDNREKY